MDSLYAGRYAGGWEAASAHRPAQGGLLHLHTLCINRARSGRGRSLEQASGGTRPPASFQTLITQFSIEGRDGETNLAKEELDRLDRESSSKTHRGAFIADLAQVPVQSGSKWGL